MSRSSVVLVALVALLPTVAGMAARADADLPCPGFTFVPAQGPSCPSPVGWRVLLRDGSSVETHGPDAVPAESGLGLAATPIAPACIGNPATEYHARLIYAVPSDVTNRYAQLLPQLRALVNETNGILHGEAASLGQVIDYKVRCTGALVDIANETLPTSSANDSFTTIVDDLKARGYNSTRVKYWIWYNATIGGGIAGQGTLHDDDRLIANNANNAGPDYAVTYNLFDAVVMAHENGHNMGAVQLSSPHNTGGFHCTDGLDVMCYNDGAANGGAYDPGVCLGNKRYDCNHDDYFHPAPPPGNYLADHWNIGSTLNRFLRFGAPGLPSAPLNLSVAAGPGRGNLTLDWQQPANDGGAAITGFNVYRGTASGSLTLLTTLGNVTTFRDTGLPDAATRYYQVAALNGAGEGPRSNEASGMTATVPGPPRNLTTTTGPGRGQVSLSWQAPASDGGAAVMSYRVHRGDASGAEEFLATAAGASFVDAGLPDGATRFYQVSAVNAVGEGARGDEAQGRAPWLPGPPRDVAGQPVLGSIAIGGGTVTFGGIKLTWQEPLDTGGVTPTNYRIYRGTTSGQLGFRAQVGNVLTYTDTVPDVTSVYHYHVRAVNVVGEGAPSAEGCSASLPWLYQVTPPTSLPCPLPPGWQERVLLDEDVDVPAALSAPLVVARLAPGGVALELPGVEVDVPLPDGATLPVEARVPVLAPVHVAPGSSVHVVVRYRWDPAQVVCVAQVQGLCVPNPVRDTNWLLAGGGARAALVLEATLTDPDGSAQRRVLTVPFAGQALGPALG